MIQYELKRDPTMPDFRIDWTFNDSYDQEIMLLQIGTDLERKMKMYE